MHNFIEQGKGHVSWVLGKLTIVWKHAGFQHDVSYACVLGVWLVGYRQWMWWIHCQLGRHNWKVVTVCVVAEQFTRQDTPRGWRSLVQRI